MIIQNLDSIICYTAAAFSLFSLLFFWIYVGENLRKVTVIEYSNYKYAVNLSYGLAVCILTFQWLTCPSTIPLVSVLMFCTLAAWSVTALSLIVLSAFFKKADNRKGALTSVLPTCFIKMLLTVVLLWLVR